MKPQRNASSHWTRMIFVVAMLLGLAANSRAQSDLRAITYQGYLEQNGTAVSGTKNLTFRLYDAATAGNQIGSAIASTVTVYAGSFATVLAPIPVSAFTGGALFLEIDVEGVTLQGRQRIYSVPFALGTSRGDDMVVSGRLGLGGAAPSASAALVVGTGANGQGGTADTLFGKSTIEIPIGDEAAGGIVMRDGQDVAQRAEVSYGSAGQQLHMFNAGKGVTVHNNGNVDLGGTLQTTGDCTVGGALQTNGDANVGGALHTNGNATVGGSLQTGNSGCRADACAGVDWVDVAGGMGWGAWRGRTYCPAHKYVCGIEQRVEGDQGGGDDTAVDDIAIICCPF